MGDIFRALGKSLERAGWRTPTLHAGTATLLGALVCLLAFAAVFGQDGNEALSLRVSATTAEPRDEAYSHVLTISWNVSGGAPPYKLVVELTGPDGVTATGESDAPAGTRSFALSYPIGGTVLVQVDVIDAAGARASGTIDVSLSPQPLPGPHVEWASCRQMAFSTEEDFLTRGPEPPDGNPIISDGDLLGAGCVVCARNHELLRAFDVQDDLGLDAIDILDADRLLAAFSTELDSPHAGQFTAGDLLFTHGAVIPNAALLHGFGIPHPDMGLDAVHFVGDPKQILEFAHFVLEIDPAYWQRLGALQASLRQYDIDIWFSTEGTAPYPAFPAFLDGDLLSARDGIIVARNALLLPGSVPAGIPTRSTDFGLDAVTASRLPTRETLHFSTEILYRGEPVFTDGDVLLILNGVIYTNSDLIRCFEPATNFVGLDALFLAEPR